MTLHDIVNSVLANLGAPYVDRDRKPPVNDEHLSLAHAAENFLTELYLEIVGVRWPSLHGSKITSAIGWPERVKIHRRHGGIPDAGWCTDVFMTMLTRELGARNLDWPKWSWK